MRIQTTKKFDKHFKKIPQTQKEKFKERMTLFVKDPRHPLLKTHQLVGAYVGFQSFNVTADIRVIFEEVDSNTIRLHLIGTHSELYG